MVNKGQHLIIRALDAHDVPEMHQIERVAHRSPWSLESLYQSMRQPGHFAYGVICEDELLGYYIFYIVLDEGHLLNICVTPAYQRQGFGRLLMQHFVEVSREKKLKQLLLEVRESNDAAIRLYEKFGFQVVGRRPAYYPAEAGREAAILMTCALTDEPSYNSRLS